MTEEQKLAIEVIRHELQYRWDKQWKIFSWTATLLLAAIGGVITLVGKQEFTFSWLHRGMMASALVVIGSYACRWIGENITFESHSRTALLGMLNQSGLAEVLPAPNSAPSFGYARTLKLLILAAVLTVLVSPAPNGPSREAGRPP